jgi:hypothetical protein
LREHEDFKEIVRDDLRKLEGEKVSRQFMRSDARVKELSCRNIAVITVFATAFVMIILLLMKFMFEMNVMPGFIIAAALGSITLAITFSSFVNARSMEHKLTSQLNQIIGKQNTIKIKFVNIQNLVMEMDRCGITNQRYVVAQALLETGYFTSRVCLECNNLFGLRRPSDGSYYEFDRWEESVKAYKNYVQFKYKGGDYLLFLKRIGYAEDPDYIVKVHQIAKTL